MKQKQNRNDENRRSDDDEVRSKLQLLTELQIHQIELESQNFDLKEMQQELELTRDNFADLYDFAPVGYLTMDQNGKILAINMTGSVLINVERSILIDKPFSAYLTHESSSLFSHYLKETFNSFENRVIELTLKTPCAENGIRYIRLESVVVVDTDTCRTIMTDISQLKITQDENHQLLLENRRLMQNLFNIQEEERRVIARELHDELGQWLTAIHAEAETISLHPDNNLTTITASSQAIKECAKEMHNVLRNLLHELRPALLDTLGLTDALQDLKKNWCLRHPDISLTFSLEYSLENLGEHINISLFRIVQESLNNISSHAEATQARLQVSRQKDVASATDNLELIVQDNGKGYEHDKSSRGLGLLGMRERAIAMGGEFMIRNMPGKGTEICVRLPLNVPNYNRRADDRRLGK